MDKHFTLEYWSDEEWYVGRLKEVPAVFSQGESIAELEENIRNAYSMIVADSEIPIPADSHTKDLVIQVEA